MIGIFASATDDIRLLLKKAKVVQTKTFGKAVVTEAVLAQKKVLLVATGYNKINLGMAVGYVGAENTLEAIIGLGNCGYLDRRGVRIGDLAIGADSVQYSVNSTAIGYPDTVIPEVGLGVFPSDPRLVALAESACRQLGYRFRTGRIATGEKFVADDRERALLAQKYGCQFIDMECGGAGEAAYLLNRPVVFVKGVSNFADRAAPSDFRAHAEVSNDRSCEVALRMLEQMPGADAGPCGPDKGTCEINPRRFRELDWQENWQTIRQSNYVSLGMSDRNIPYVVPMCFELDRRYPEQIRLFSRPYGKKMACMENNENVVLEFVRRSEKGIKSVVASGCAKKNEGRSGDGMTSITVSIRSVTGREYFDR